MTRRGWMIAVLMFFVGLGVFERYLQLCEDSTTEVFSRRLRCNDMARQYVKEEATDTNVVRIELVGYSKPSNSCVADFLVWDQFGTTSASSEWRVIDLLSHEQLYFGSCWEQRDCGNGNNIKLSKESDIAFHRAMNGH